MIEELEDMLKPQEVAAKLKVGKSTIYHLAARGILPGAKIGGALRFRPSRVAKYIEELEKSSLGAAA